MKVRYLVLLALVCLFAVASAHKEEKPERPERPERPPDNDEYEYEVIRKEGKKEKSSKKEKKVIKEVVVTKKEKKPKVVESCDTLLKPEREDCLTNDIPEGYKSVFEIKNEENCEWACNYEALPTEAPVAPPPQPKKKVKKLKKKKPAKNLKECSGEKKIRFSNCLVKVNGLIAWGAKTKGFDKKFEKFLKQAKSKKGKKKARKARKA